MPTIGLGPCCPVRVSTGRTALPTCWSWLTASLKTHRRTLISQSANYLRCEPGRQSGARPDRSDRTCHPCRRIPAERIREPTQTCLVCSTPLDAHSRCAPCNSHWHQFGNRRADMVVCLSYAVAGRQSGLVMRQYKDNPRPKVRDDLSATVSLTLFYGLVKHERCIESQLAMPVNIRVTVPSLGGRSGIHPLTKISDAMQATSEGCRLIAAPGATSAREVKENQYDVSPANSVRGAHVLVIDDTWTSGSHAQSAALTLRGAGAARITVLARPQVRHSSGVTARMTQTRTS